MGGSRFFCFVGRFEDRFMGLISSYQLINFEEKKKHAAFALRIYMTMVERWIFIRLCRVDKVGELEIFVRERLGKKKFLVIFAFKKFGKKSKGCYFLRILEIISIFGSQVKFKSELRLSVDNLIDLELGRDL